MYGFRIMFYYDYFAKIINYNFKMKDKAITVLLVGAPSTGKTSILNKLHQQGFICFEEISRQVTQEARDEGIEHLFKENPLLFSEKLLDGRIRQFLSAQNFEGQSVFIDRGLPDITAYLEMVNVPYSQKFVDANINYRYDVVFWFPVWEHIYTYDDERYEDFELSKTIEKNLLNSYKSLSYKLIEVPKAPINKRVDFILSHLNLKC